NEAAVLLVELVDTGSLDAPTEVGLVGEAPHCVHVVAPGAADLRGHHRPQLRPWPLHLLVERGHELRRAGVEVADVLVGRERATCAAGFLVPEGLRGAVDLLGARDESEAPA